MSQQFKPEDHINDTVLRNFAKGTLPFETEEIMIEPHLNQCPYCSKRYQIQREQFEMEEKTATSEIYNDGQHVSEGTMKQILNEETNSIQIRMAISHIHKCRECLQIYTQMGVLMGKKIL